MVIIGIVGNSGTGKTTLVESILRELSARGIAAASIKHVHGSDVLIPEGKDTSRHLQAGSRVAVGISPNETVVYMSGGGKLDDAIELLENVSSADVILVEGFKRSAIPKIVLGDAEVCGEVLLRCPDPKDCVRKGVEIIEGEVRVEGALRSLPGIDCRKCGYSSCREFAEAVAGGEVDITDCGSRADGRTRILVDGRLVPLGRFVSDLVASTIMGLVNSLKEVGEPKRIEIYVDAQPSWENERTH